MRARLSELKLVERIDISGMASIRRGNFSRTKSFERNPKPSLLFELLTRTSVLMFKMVSCPHGDVTALESANSSLRT